MISRYDGGEYPIKKRSRIILVFFGDTNPDLEEVLENALKQFIDSIQEDLPVIPHILCRYEPLPRNIPHHNQHRVFFSALQKINGNIVIGITGNEFYDPQLSRNIFCYGQVDGRGLLSTYRFRKETTNSRMFLERLGKQVIRVLAMASTVDSCFDSDCIISHHQRVEDLDRNWYVCEPCRKDFIRNLAFFLNVPEGRQGTLLLPEYE
jgi:predicted Zn-dependent protease